MHITSKTYTTKAIRYTHRVITVFSFISLEYMINQISLKTHMILISNINHNVKPKSMIYIVTLNLNI